MLRKDNTIFETISIAGFTKKVLEIMNKHTPIKKCLLTNHANLVIKNLRKTIMLRYLLRKIFLKEAKRV